MGVCMYSPMASGQGGDARARELGQRGELKPEGRCLHGVIFDGWFLTTGDSGAGRCADMGGGGVVDDGLFG